jgi:hypothetical protein
MRTQVRMFDALPSWSLDRDRSTQPRTSVRRAAGPLVALLLLTALVLPGASLRAQDAVYYDNFTNGVTPSAAQCTQWNNFRASLQPGMYNRVVIRGTYDPTGLTTDDITIVNAFANAIKNGLDYISPITYGNYWSVCGTRYSR